LLALKLVLVPAFLLLVSLASRRWGPVVAGWLAGFPVVAGPIVLLVALEHGELFASMASSAALAAVFASVAFYLAYTHAACGLRLQWPAALFVALCVWTAAAFLLAQLPNSAPLSLLVAAITLVVGPRLFPAVALPSVPRPITSSDLVVRMLAGALLTLLVTELAETVGSQWSGLLAVVPLLGSVLAVFSHRSQGAAFTTTLLRAMTTGLYSLASFFVVLSFALPTLGIAVSFVLGVAVAVAAQGAIRGLTVRRTLQTGAEPPAPIR
jgi:uncharacterized membrane protein (GlpM family)